MQFFESGDKPLTGPMLIYGCIYAPLGLNEFIKKITSTDAQCDEILKYIKLAVTLSDWCNQRNTNTEHVVQCIQCRFVKLQVGEFIDIIVDNKKVFPNTYSSVTTQKILEYMHANAYVKYIDA